MELHAPDREIAVRHPHDLPLVGPGGDVEIRGQALPFDEERVVAGGGERVGQPAEEPLPVVVHRPRSCRA